LLYSFGGFFIRRLRGKFHIYHHEIRLERREKTQRFRKKVNHGDCNQSKRNHQDQFLSLQTPFQCLPIMLLQCFGEFSPSWLYPPCTRWNDDCRYEQRRRKCEDERNGEILEQSHYKTCEEHYGKKNRNGCECGSKNRQPHLSRTFSRSVRYWITEGAMAVYVLKHDYGIVHQHSQCHDETAQRERVEVQAEGVKKNKGDREGQRNGKRSDDG